MAEDTDSRRTKPGIPPPQRNLDRATEMAFAAIRDQRDDQIRWLGAEPAQHLWHLPVLDDTLVVDLLARQVTTSAGAEVGPHWRILALHYLAVAERPEPCQPEVTFADLPTARSYAGVYQGRVIARLCGTVGRSADTLRAAAEALGGRAVDGGDLAFDFALFPRLTLRLIWHAPDDEFPPSGSMLLPPNIESYFCSEDIVVLSERLVSRLCGRPF
jgi:hypothetical protein